MQQKLTMRIIVSVFIIKFIDIDLKHLKSVSISKQTTTSPYNIKQSSLKKLMEIMYTFKAYPGEDMAKALVQTYLCLKESGSFCGLG